MPIYEYECTQCGERFAVHQAMGEDGSKLNCPKCQAQNPKRLFSSFLSPGLNKSKSERVQSSSTKVRKPQCGAQYRLDKYNKKRR